MTKKKITVLSVSAAILVIAVIAGIVLTPYLIPRKFETVLNYNPAAVTKIHFTYGKTGLSAEVTDPEEIGDFLAWFKDVSLKRAPTLKKPSDRVGFVLSVNFYNQEDILLAKFRCAASGAIADSIANRWYHMNKEFSEDQINQLLKKYKIGVEERQRLDEALEIWDEYSNE